jgi:ribose transport system permease protein
MKEKIATRMKSMKTEGTLVVILGLLIVVISIASIVIHGQNRFVFGDNPYNLVRQISIIGIVAIGMTFVIIGGGIDLSVGSMVGFSGMVVALMLRDGNSIIISILVSLIACALFGLLNGVLVFDGKLPPFIATLGTMTIIRAIIMLLSGARLVSGLPRGFTEFAQVRVLFLPSLFVVWVVIIAISTFITTRMRFGRNLYAIGSSQEVSRLCGINIRINTYSIYMYSALMSAIAGILLSSRLANGVPNAGQGYELDAIAASVVGGASFYGAEGTIIGTVLGTIIIATIKNGGNILGVDPFILQILNGALIILAVLLDQMRKRRSMG